MNILYIGDVMGRAGRDTVVRLLPELKKEHSIDLVIAQSENVSHGKSMTPHHMDQLMDAGVDFFTGGNHSYKRDNLHERLESNDSPVIGVANTVEEVPGKGYQVLNTPTGDVLIVSLLGSVFPEEFEIENPLQKIDQIIAELEDRDLAATVVNIHTDYSSEKVIMGNYLDGKVTLVVGDHWHIPTADYRLLPGGTGYMTDVGMCGALDSSLGVEYESVTARWKTGEVQKRVMAEHPPYQFNALLAKDVGDNGLPGSVEYIRKIIE